MNREEHSPPSSRRRRSEGSNEGLPRLASAQAPKKRGTFAIVPNKIVITEGTTTAALVIDSGCSCSDIKAWLTQTGGEMRHVDLLLTPLSRSGVYSFDVPDGALGKYHVHVRNSERSLGIRSFTVSGVTAELVYNLSNPLKIMAHALGVHSKEELDEQLSRSFVSCTPRDTMRLQAAFSNETNVSQDQGATASCEVPTLLHFACKYGLTSLLSKLTGSPGARTLCAMKNSRGETPHEIAVSAGHAEAAEIVRQLQEQEVGEEKEWEKEQEEDEEEEDEEEEDEEEDDDGYTVARAPARTYVNLTDGEDQRAAGDQQPDTGQSVYVDMGDRLSTKPPKDQEDYCYAMPVSGLGQRRYSSAADDDHHTVADPPLPPSRATRPCGPAATAPTNDVRAGNLMTAPVFANSAAKGTLLTAVAAIVELDELSKVLQTMVKNGEITQSDAVTTFESTRVMKTKLTAVQAQQKEEKTARNSVGRSLSAVQSLISEYLRRRDVELEPPPPLLARSSKTEKTHGATSVTAAPKTATSAAAGATAKVATGVGASSPSLPSAPPRRTSSQSNEVDFRKVSWGEPDEPVFHEPPRPRRASRSRET